MDALPIQERTNLDFASRNEGVVRACGHDIHTTVGLGAAMILSQLEGKMPGHVRFLFQPAEEIAQGAQWMIKDGAMQDVDGILGVHVFPTDSRRLRRYPPRGLTTAADDLELIVMGESGAVRVPTRRSTQFGLLLR